VEEVIDFIETLPKDEQILARRLRTLIFEAEPRIQEKLSYGVPTFTETGELFFYGLRQLAMARRMQRLF
jgi:uncharacterized protein YdhG (YjbR/CyaY superfamily)